MQAVFFLSYIKTYAETPPAIVQKIHIYSFFYIPIIDFLHLKLCIYHFSFKAVRDIMLRAFESETTLFSFTQLKQKADPQLEAKPEPSWARGSGWWVR